MDEKKAKVKTVKEAKVSSSWRFPYSRRYFRNSEFAIFSLKTILELIELAKKFIQRRLDIDIENLKEQQEENENLND